MVNAVPLRQPAVSSVVTGNDWRRSDLQARYRGHFTPFTTQLIKQQTSYPGDGGMGDPPDTT